MFNPGHWAAAYVGSLERHGGEAAEGARALGVLVPWVKSLPGAVFGTSAALKLEKLIREGMAKTGIAPAAIQTAATQMAADQAAWEIATRFLVLIIRKNVLHHIDAVIDEIKKIQDKKEGIVHVFAEYAFPPEDGFEDRVKEAVKKWTGAARVELDGKVNAELVGGYRLRMGDEVVDASVRTQLMKLEACLAAGLSGSGNGGN